jgi:phosphoserine phosphatase
MRQNMIKLICLDIEGVIMDSQAFWLRLHEAYGTLEQGKELTQKYVKTDYARLVEEVVVKLWKGRDERIYHNLVRSIEYNPGAKELFEELDQFKDAHGHTISRAAISGSAYELADRVNKDHGITFIFANQLLFEDDKVSGKFKWPVGHGGYTKQQIIEQLCDDLEILPSEVLVIGDSEGDIEAMRIAGVSIAFNAKTDDVKAIATYTVDSKDLTNLVPVLRKIREEAGVGSSTEEPGSTP